MKYIALALSALILASCAGASDPYSAIPIEKYYGTPSSTSETAAPFVVADSDGEALFLDFNSGEYLKAAYQANFCVQNRVAESSAGGNALAAPQLVGMLQRCIEARNSIINDYLRVSDLACRNHIDGIQSTSTALNSGLSFTTNLATALGTFVTGGVAVKELSALGNVANSSRSIVNEQVYFQAIAPQITRLIREDRKTSRAALVQDMAKSPSDYTLDQALADLSAYHAACSFAAALEQISAAQAKPSVTPSGGASGTAKWTISIAAPDPKQMNSNGTSDVITLNAKSAVAGFSVAPISYTVQAGNSVVDIASQLAKKVASESAKFAVSDVTLQPDGYTAKFMIEGGPQDIKWSGSSNAKAEVVSTEVVNSN